LDAEREYEPVMGPYSQPTLFSAVI
jgi:hypothetical protein